MPTDPLVLLHARVPAEVLAALDANAAAHGEDRSAAVRRLLPLALGLPEQAPRVAVELAQVDLGVLEAEVARRLGGGRR